ncbi:ankyrin repeat domain-containing protein 13C-like isoform X2 [Salvelinus namaycush]|uniref:Ankyrin repeat domain-containing protein 13C-like isoform X2 n=1 Tax=Salvelinus namaycush TaxID=8040 RepID=A0A8U1ENG3_SALNM|nr:ankyrin repeat domain-containing protein 13C-like isoform X2 [Salvelinus namaycush]
MTGEKIRTLRKDHNNKPSKDGAITLMETFDESTNGTITSPTPNGTTITYKSNKNHNKTVKPMALQQQLSNINATNANQSVCTIIDDYNKNPIILTNGNEDLNLEFPVHECVFRGDVRRLSSLIRTQNISQKDVHGNTPLHVAVMMGHKECALLLLAHNAPVKVKNAQGWSPLAEAISYGDRQMMPLLSRILPSDNCKIYKQGINIRLDTTLIDFSDMKCQRGDLSFIFNGDAPPSKSFYVLDNEQKVYQRIHHEESEMETEEEVDILMSSDVYSATLSTKSITFSRSQIGWLFRQDKTERVGNFLADFYSVNGLVLESRKRREHLSEEDVLRNKAIMESLSKGGNLVEQNYEPQRRLSLTAPDPNTISWEEYISAEHGKAPHLGRELVCKESKKNFKATVAMSQDFPLGIESLLNVLEVIAPFKHFNKLREFVQMKLPPGFPVKLDIPVFPTITATVTFQEFRYDDFEESIFSIPADYKEDPSRFPDL